jgi:hypothetical protein
MSSEEQTTLTPTRLAQIGGVSVPFASQVLGGLKGWPRKLAIRVVRETGQKFGPMANASKEEIVGLEKFP